MDETQFQNFLDKLNTISVSLKEIAAANEELIDNKADQAKKDKTAIAQNKLTTAEKKRTEEIAKIYAKTFNKTLQSDDEEKKNANATLKNIFKRQTIKVHLESVSKEVINNLAKVLSTKKTNDLLEKLLKTDKKQDKPGLFGNIFQGLAGLGGLFGGLKTLLMIGGGIAIILSLIKNFDKITNFAKTVIPLIQDFVISALPVAGRELPPILKAISESLYPFFKRIMDTVDTAIKQLPELFNILLKNLPALGAALGGFIGVLTEKFKNFFAESFDMKIQDFFAVLAGIAAGAVGIEVFFYLMKKTGDTIAGFIKQLPLAKTALVLVGLAVAINQFRKAMEAFGGMDTDAITKGFAVIIGGGAAGAGFIYVMQQLAKSFDLKAAASVAAVFAAAYFLPKIIESFGPALSSLGKGIEDLSNATNTSGFGKAIGILGGFFALLVTGSAAVYATGGTAALAGLATEALLAGLAGNILLFGNALTSLATGFEKLGPAVDKLDLNTFKKIIPAMADLSAALFIGSVGQAATGIAGAFGSVTNFINFLTGKKDYIESIISLADRVDKIEKVSGAVKGLNDVFVEISTRKIGQSFNDEMSLVRQGIEKLTTIKDLNKLDSITNFVNGIASGSSVTGAAVDLAAQGATALVQKNLRSAQQYAKNMMPDFDGMTDSFNNMNKDLKDLVKTAKEQMKVMKQGNEHLVDIKDKEAASSVLVNNQPNTMVFNESSKGNTDFRADANRGIYMTA
jgi:hypothetical protein